MSVDKTTRVLGIFFKGFFKGLFMLLLYVVLIPRVLAYISTGLLQTGQPAIPTINIWYYVSLLVLFVSLETIAIINKRNVYGLLASALSKIIGLLFIIYALNGGVIKGSFETDNMLVSIKLDITPLLLFITAYTFATIVLSSIDMSYEES